MSAGTLDRPAWIPGVVRRAQAIWAGTPLDERVAVVATFRRWLAAHTAAAGASVTHGARASRAETLVAEVAPLLEAARFLERSAARVLAPRTEGSRGRPAWLGGCRASVERLPWGVVLILGPANYPLMLPGIQVLQALVAGNAVVLKPGAGGAAAAALLRRGLRASGLPPHCLTVLEDSDEAGADALEQRVDHVVLTGARATGEKVLARLAPRLTPATVELSGHDACIVLPGADLELTAQALAFGASLNGGATCIAPRRVLVPVALRADLERRLVAALADRAAVALPARTAAQLEPVLREARQSGARVECGGWSGAPAQGRFLPMLLTGVSPAMRVFDSDLGAPVLMTVPYSRLQEAVAFVNGARYRLGASVFGPETEARAVASALDVGTVLVNDLVVPTADPRLPFGGTGASGYGVTRGREGLLGMTRPRVTVVRAGRRRPHYARLAAAHAPVIAALLRLIYGDAATRWRALCSLPATVRALNARTASRYAITIRGEQS